MIDLINFVPESSEEAELAPQLHKLLNRLRAMLLEEDDLRGTVARVIDRGHYGFLILEPPNSGGAVMQVRLPHEMVCKKKDHEHNTPDEGDLETLVDRLRSASREWGNLSEEEQGLFIDSAVRSSDLEGCPDCVIRLMLGTGKPIYLAADESQVQESTYDPENPPPVLSITTDINKAVQVSTHITPMPVFLGGLHKALGEALEVEVLTPSGEHLDTSALRDWDYGPSRDRHRRVFIEEAGGQLETFAASAASSLRDSMPKGMFDTSFDTTVETLAAEVADKFFEDLKERNIAFSEDERETLLDRSRSGTRRGYVSSLAVENVREELMDLPEEERPTTSDDLLDLLVNVLTKHLEDAASEYYPEGVKDIPELVSKIAGMMTKSMSAALGIMLDAGGEGGLSVRAVEHTNISLEEFEDLRKTGVTPVAIKLPPGGRDLARKYLSDDRFSEIMVHYSDPTNPGRRTDIESAVIGLMVMDGHNPLGDDDHEGVKDALVDLCLAARNSPDNPARKAMIGELEEEEGGE